jgi:hypothetical protein
MQTPPLSLPRLSWQLPRLSWQSGSLAIALLLVLTTCAPTGGDGDASLRFTPTALDTPGEQAPFAAADLDATPTGGALGSPDAGDPEPPVDGAGAVQEPAPEEPAPQQVLTPAPLPDEVDLHEPDLLVRAADEQLPVDPAEVEGAEYVTGVGELIARAEDASGAEHELELLAVDPIAFRPLTPDVTAQSRAVWERLDDGDILVRHDVAYELGLELGEHMELRTDAGDVTVRIGALAANGAPPFADIIVPFEVAAQLGSPGVNALVVSAQQEAESLVEALEPLGDVELRRPPEPEQSTSRPTNGSVELEPFTYTSRGDGTIAIHGDWASATSSTSTSRGWAPPAATGPWSPAVRRAAGDHRRGPLRPLQARAVRRLLGPPPHHVEPQPRPVDARLGPGDRLQRPGQLVRRRAPDGPPHRRDLQEVGLRLGRRLVDPRRHALRGGALRPGGVSRGRSPRIRRVRP